MSLNANDFQAATYNAKPSVRVYRSITQTITTATTTNIDFDTKVYDRWGMSTAAASPSESPKLTVKVPGIYLVTVSSSFTANTTGRRILTISQYNSSATLRTHLSRHDDESEGATGNWTASISGLSLVAESGDYFVTTVHQTSGGNLNLRAAAATTQHIQSFSAMWVSSG